MLVRMTAKPLMRGAASVLAALLGAFLFMKAADRQRLGASEKEVPQVAGGEPFTARTLELTGAPGWVLLTSGLLGAVVFGTAAWFFLGWLSKRRVRS